MSPAMDAALRVFRRVSGLPDNDDDDKNAGSVFCSVRLLVASTQAINLIGKQGSLIKSIVENSGASVRILSEGICLSSFIKLGLFSQYLVSEIVTLYRVHVSRLDNNM